MYERLDETPIVSQVDSTWDEGEEVSHRAMRIVSSMFGHRGTLCLLVEAILNVHGLCVQWVRFLDTLWADVRKSSNVDAPRSSVGASGDPIYTQKVVRVRGCTSGDIFYIPKNALVAALSGDVSAASRFVSPDSKVEVFCHWEAGYVRDKRGRRKEGHWAEVAVERDSGKSMRPVARHPETFVL